MSMDGSTAASRGETGGTTGKDGTAAIRHNDAKGLNFLKGRKAHPMEGKVDLLADYEGLDIVREKYVEWIYKDIPLNSYTVFRMEYSTPDHMDRSSRVMVVGPLAKDWVDQQPEKVMKRYAGSSLGPFFNLASKVFPKNAISKPKKMLVSKLHRSGDDLLEELMQMYDSSGSEFSDSDEVASVGEHRPRTPEGDSEAAEDQDVSPDRFLSAQKQKKSFFGRTTWNEVGSSSRDKSKTFNNTVRDTGSFSGSRFARGKTTPEPPRRGTGTFSDQLNAQSSIPSPGRRNTFRRNRKRSNSKGKSIMTDSDYEEEEGRECLPEEFDVSTPIVKLPGYGDHRRDVASGAKSVPAGVPGVTTRHFNADGTHTMSVGPSAGLGDDESYDSKAHTIHDLSYREPAGVLSQQPQGSALQSLKHYTGPDDSSNVKIDQTDDQKLPVAPHDIPRRSHYSSGPSSSTSASDLPLFTQASSHTSQSSYDTTTDSFHSAESSLGSSDDDYSKLTHSQNISDAEDLSDEFDTETEDRNRETVRKTNDPHSILVAPKRADVLKGKGIKAPTSSVSGGPSKVKFSGSTEQTPGQKLRAREENLLPRLKEQSHLPQDPHLMETSDEFGNNGKISASEENLILNSTVAEAPRGPEGQEPDHPEGIDSDFDPTLPHTNPEQHSSMPRPGEGVSQSDYYVQFQENFVNRAKTVAGKMRAKSSHAKESTVKNWRFLRDRTAGEIVRLEKMLVMVKTTPAINLPKDFNEMETGDTRVLERWREYIVVARSTGDPENPISLQFYSSRSIKAVEKVAKGKTDAKMFLTLGHHVNVSLYSSLDKTIALWYSGKRETVIYILRARSAYSSIRWFEFFSEILGARREKEMHVRVPDLAVVVTVKVSWRKFRLIDEYISGKLMASSKTGHSAVLTARAHQYVTEKALKALLENPRFKPTIEDWVKNKRVGLGWRRYDRLEWVQGFGEQELHGSWALNRTHDLEMRVKEHYGDKVTIGGEELEEPTPIEGHLVRLKSWNPGKLSKKNNALGKLLYKNLYFSTHDYFLFFAKPGNAILPLPDDDLKDQETSNEAQKQWVYEIAPFRSGKATGRLEGCGPVIEWLKPGISEAEFQKRDTIALHNMQRRAAQIIKADGFINLLEVAEVRATKRQTEVDHGVGSEDNHIDFDGSRILHGGLGTEDGEVGCFDESKTFELVMDNGLIVRLQAYNLSCRNLWVTRLRELIVYWKKVSHHQLQVSSDFRTNNMKRLYIDDKLDAAVGESSPKWETARATASTTLYNVSGISWSRSIIMKGMLYHKTHTHSSFRQYFSVLCHGHLILYEVYRRNIAGVPIDKVDYERFRDIPLKEAYVYSGNIAEPDILTRDEMSDLTSDRVVPRIYKDGWKSAESETLRCIILWFPRKKAVTSSSARRLRTVNRLGVSGHRFIFVARSRQEKEQWVMALSHEIEKLVEPDFADINIVK